jgi:hypothetical protein
MRRLDEKSLRMFGSWFFDVGGGVNLLVLVPALVDSFSESPWAHRYSTHLENKVAIGQNIFLEQSFLTCGRTFKIVQP